MNLNDKQTKLIQNLPFFDGANWEEIVEVFSDVEPLEFGQFWLGGTQPAFRPGEVRLGWRGDRLLYFADLVDDEIDTQAIRRNEQLWKLGDVLELFAGIEGQAAYVEYHAAPNGIILQLFWPDADALKTVKKPGQLETFCVEDDSAVCRVRILEGRWQVYGELPRTSLQVESQELAGEIWEIGFGRYDCYRDGTVVLSNTSPLVVPSYHHRENWRRFKFC